MLGWLELQPDETGQERWIALPAPPGTPGRGCSQVG
jgi:hypothetical protein